MDISATTAKPAIAFAPDLSQLPDEALLTDRQKACLSGFTVEAFKKWRREGRGPATIYIEGRPRSTVRAYREWIERASQKVAS